MKLVTPFLKPVVILVGLLLVMPMTVMAGKPDAGAKAAKGGKPNENSVALTAACTMGDDTARVCSCKGLSNVVLWCGGTWVKHEDFGSGEVYDTTVACVDGEGNPIPGPITMVAIKSGSQKNVTIDGAPSGSGLFTFPAACSSEFVCPTAGDCKGGDEPPSNEPPSNEPPSNEPPGDEPPGDEPPGDEPPGDEPPGDEPPSDEPPSDGPILG